MYNIIMILVAILNLYIGFHGKIDAFNLITAGFVLGLWWCSLINDWMESKIYKNF